MKKIVLVLVAVFLLSACGSGTETKINPSGSAQAGTKIVAAIGSVSSDPWASLSTITLDDAKTVTQKIVQSDGNYATVKGFGGLIYIINPIGTDTIQVIDPSDSFKSVADYSVGSGSNPQDIIVAGAKAYISRLDAQNDATDTNDVLIVNPTTGEKLGSIDLTDYTDPSGDRLARAEKMVLVGTNLYVLIQDLSQSFADNTNGKIAVIDTKTDTVTSVIQLNGFDPYDIAYEAGAKKLYVSVVGGTWTADTSSSLGGIEVVDPATGKTEGIKIDDADLGGTVYSMKIGSKDIGYVVTSSPTYTNTLASFNPSTGAVISKSVYTSAAYIPDFQLVSANEIVLTDTDPVKGGVVFLNGDGTVTAGPLGIGASPSSLAIIDVK